MYCTYFWKGTDTIRQWKGNQNRTKEDRQPMRKNIRPRTKESSQPFPTNHHRRYHYTTGYECVWKRVNAGLIENPPKMKINHHQQTNRQEGGDSRGGCWL